MKVLKLNKELFRKGSIRQAIGDYVSLCSIEMRETPCEYLLSFSDCKYGEERTMMEFENYLIGMENQ